MAAVRHLGFFKLKFLAAAHCRDTFCIIVPNFVELGHAVTDMSQLLRFLVKRDNSLDDSANVS